MCNLENKNNAEQSCKIKAVVVVVSVIVFELLTRISLHEQPILQSQEDDRIE